MLVADDPTAHLARRIADELEGVGFFVVTRDDNDVLDVLNEARAVGAPAAVEVHGRRIDLWADLWRDDGAHPAHAAVLAGPDDGDIVALRVAELLRARTLDSAPPTARHSAAVAATTLRVEPRVHDGAALSVAAGPAAALFAGAPPPLRAFVAVTGTVGDIDLSARVHAPLLPATVSADTGSADLWLTDAVALAGWRARFDDVALVVGAGAGALWTHGVGHAPPGRAHAGDLVSGVLAADVAVWWHVQGPLSFWLDVEAGAVVPRPVLLVGATEVGVGPAFGSAAAGLALSFPEPP